MPRRQALRRWRSTLTKTSPPASILPEWSGHVGRNHTGMESSVSEATPSEAEELTASLSRQQAWPWPVLVRAAGALAFALLLLAFLWDRTINHDTAWYLIATRKWLEGARLYVDIYEVNPPLAFYLTVPAIWLSDALSIDDVNGLYAYLAALTGLSLFFSASLLDARIKAGTANRVVAFLGLGAVLALPGLPQFGQREQLMVLFALPWFITQIPTRQGETPRRTGHILLAIAAAIGICIKPYFMTIPFAVFVWRILVEKSARPLFSLEALAMTATGAAYVVATALLHPEFFSDLVPTARLVYLSFGLPGLFVASRLLFGALPYLAFFLLLAVNRRSAGMPGLFIAAMIGATSAYLLQWNGFDYHLVPFWAFADLALLWTLLTSPRRSPLFLVALATAATVGAIAADRGTYDFRSRPAIDAAMGDAPPPKNLFAASMSVDTGPLLALDRGARWASRYPHHWTLAGALAGLANTDCDAKPAACASIRAILARTREADISDIATFRPEMILIDKRHIFIADPDFSWYDFFAGDPRWPALIARYRLAGSTEDFDTWALRTADN
jgi:hypothetical protein